MECRKSKAILMHTPPIDVEFLCPKLKSLHLRQFTGSTIPWVLLIRQITTWQFLVINLDKDENLSFQIWKVIKCEYGFGWHSQAVPVCDTEEGHTGIPPK